MHPRPGRRGDWRAPWPDSLFGRALLLVAVPSVMLVGLLVAFTVVQRRQADAQAWSLHARDVSDHAQQLLSQLADAQAGTRGYLLAREPAFLEPYHRAVRQLPVTLTVLQRLTRHSPQQQARVRSLERHVGRLLVHYEDALRSPASLQQASALVVDGKRLMDETRVEARALRDHEHALDQQRRLDLGQADRRLFGVVVGGTGASLFAVLTLGVWFHRGLRGRVADLTDAARRLTAGQPVAPTVDDELGEVDAALRDLAQTLAQQQRAAIGALADAVRLFSAAESTRAVLDIAVERTLVLSGAGIALCTLDGDAGGASQVVSASASSAHPSAAPAPGMSFSWPGVEEVMRTGRPLTLSAEDRRARGVPPEVERVIGPGTWLGVPILDDRRVAIGVLQVATVSGRTLRDEERDVVGTLAQAASVALALERSRRRLERVNADLAFTNRENELFIYSVSHDLRSPLVNLEGFSRELASATDAIQRELSHPSVPQAVRDRVLPLIESDVAESIRFIRTAVGRLAAIIDGLLRLSRAGRVEYRAQELALDRVVRRVVDAMHASLSDAGGEVRVAPLPRVSGDALAVEQLFANLLGNALAYARPGVAPRIEVHAEDDLASAPAFTVIRVSDNGLGIAEAHLEKVFKPLQRLHPGVGTGEGMGLAIVRRIVERHGGRIWVRSRVGAGTTFYVELPRYAGEPSTHAS